MWRQLDPTSDMLLHVPANGGEPSPRLAEARRRPREAIQTRIVTGDIPAGARLRQEQLAAEYKLSRTPIREALRKLQAEGTVELVPNQGAVVRGPTVRDVREGYEVRAELEGMAAALAATWITDVHLTRAARGRGAVPPRDRGRTARPGRRPQGAPGCAPTTSSTRRSRPPPATSGCGARSATSTRRSPAA